MALEGLETSKESLESRIVDLMCHQKSTETIFCPLYCTTSANAKIQVTSHGEISELYSVQILISFKVLGEGKYFPPQVCLQYSFLLTKNTFKAKR